MGYLFRFDNLVLEMALIMTNIVFYAMEMKYIVCKNLNLNLGEIGPVEVELIVAIVLVLGSVYGSDIYQQTLFETFGVENELFKDIKIKFLSGGILTPL